MKKKLIEEVREVRERERERLRLRLRLRYILIALTMLAADKPDGRKEKEMQDKNTGYRYDRFP